MNRLVLTIAGIVFVLLSIAGILRHEMWLDEIYYWLLARDSSSFIELSNNGRYDTHPMLWTGMLFILSRLTHNPVSMQLLHIAISCTTVLLILKYAPFSTTQKILLIFGYFFFYEYNLISRNYSPGILLTIISCILFENRRKHYILLSIVLSLMANTHFLCLVVSITFFLSLLVDHILFAQASRWQTRTAVVGLIIYILSVGLAMFQIMPPSDSSIITNLNNEFHLLGNAVATTFPFHRLGNAVAILTKGFLPLPVFSNVDWWNSNWFVSASQVINGTCALLIFFIPFFILYKKLIPLILFYTTVFGTILFIFISQFDSAHYYGFVFVSFFAALWIGSYYTDSDKLAVSLLLRIQPFIKAPFIYAVLIIQLIAGTGSYLKDFSGPFSQGKNVAKYLQTSGLVRKNIAINSSVAGSSIGPSVAGYLDKKVFYPDINQWGTYCKWNLPHTKTTLDSTIVNKVTLDSNIVNIERLCVRSDSDFVLLSNVPIDTKRYSDLAVHIHFVKDFTGGTVKNEDYFIYLVSPK